MKYENIQRAAEIKDEIDTLEAEINEIEKIGESGRRNRSWLFSKILKEKPKLKTYKKFYCSAGIDYINSIVLINQREAQAVIKVKKQEIEELKELVKTLD